MVFVLGCCAVVHCNGSKVIVGWLALVAQVTPVQVGLVLRVGSIWTRMVCADDQMHRECLKVIVGWLAHVAQVTPVQVGVVWRVSWFRVDLGWCVLRHRPSFYGVFQHHPVKEMDDHVTLLVLCLWPALGEVGDRFIMGNV